MKIGLISRKKFFAAIFFRRLVPPIWLNLGSMQRFFNCDSNWYPVRPTFFPVSKLARRWDFLLPVVVILALCTFNCRQVLLHAWKLTVFLRSILGSIYFRQSWKLHFWKLHEKSVLLVTEFFYFAAIFFTVFLECYF